MFNNVLTMDEFNKIAGLYGRNFFRLTLPFLLVLAVSLGVGLFGPPEAPLPTVLVGLAFGLLLLFAAGSATIDSWGAYHGLEFGLRQNWKYLGKKLPLLLVSTVVTASPWLLMLYLFLNFYSFFLFVPLAVYPFFFVYLVPGLLIKDEGPVAAVKDSFRTSWSHTTRTAVITYVPGMLVIGLSSVGIYSPIFLLIAPVWFVFLTVTYCNFTECPKSIEGLNLDNRRQ
jgi:hypothetical protein